MSSEESEELSTSSLQSDQETVSSSGLLDREVGIFFHAAMFTTTKEVERILSEKEIASHLSYRDAPAGRSKLANVYSIANHCRVRVFLITKKFIREDLQTHLRLLENANNSTKTNTLLLMRKAQRRILPEYLKDFPCYFLGPHITGEQIAQRVVDFLRNHNDDCSESSGRMQERQDEPVEELLQLTLKVDASALAQHSTKFERFSKIFGRVGKKRGYILITSPIQEKNPGLRNIVLIPWLRVFDFDPKSRVKGLLSVTEGTLEKTRHHTKTDQLDHIELPDENVTNWVFINGYTDSAETLQAANKRISEPTIYKHGESLVEYCVGRKVPVVVVMWYPAHNNDDQKLDSFLSGIRHHFMGRLNCFNCVVCLGKMPNKHSYLYVALRRLDLLDNIIVVPMEILCYWLSSSLNDTPPTPTKAKILPKYPDEGEELISAEVDEEDLRWIRVYFDILVMPQAIELGRQPTSKTTDTQKGIKFLKGGEIDWSVLDSGNFDVRRDLLEKAKNYIQEEHIRTGKPGFITIYHSPGGGGSTFARRLLWELRETVPCVMMTSSQIVLKEVEERLMFIRNLTRLPTVLLLDGYSVHDVKKIFATCRAVRMIVIHVRRFYQQSDKAPSGTNKFLLRSRVSLTEAKEFCSVYSKAAPRKKVTFQGLSKLVELDKAYYVFEYGLIAFQAEFHGVRRYVHGYLQVHKGRNLESWHTILVFLSMANYYGHRGLPSKLFGKILEKDDNETVELDDLPHSARQFITELDQDWKITHYIVSKLILEQVLVRRSTTDYAFDQNSLTKEASKELAHWALKFITNIKDNTGTSGGVASHINEILRAIFIRRNYNDPGESEDLVYGMKSSYSKLLEEMSSKGDQRKILEKLVECFPGDAEFRAHLGRFLTKQGEFEAAEGCFRLAIESRRRFVQVVTSPARGDDVLERIYNMSGFGYMSRIRSEIGARLGDIKPTTLKGKLLPTLVEFCLDKANKAIESFDNGRVWYQKGSNPCFADMGELKVRLVLTELAREVSQNNFDSLISQPTPFKELGNFVLKSFHECDLLLAHCIDRGSNFDVPEEEINICFNHFNVFFANATTALERWAGDDSSVRSMRCHLSILKIKLKQKKWRFRLTEDVKTTKQISLLIDLCEKICNTVCRDESSNIRISSYMMDWLKAIRHSCVEKHYSQKDVLSRVMKWKARKEPGSLANFYNYVLTTLLALCTVSRETASAYSEKSLKIKEHMRMQNDAVPLHLLDATEWLARCDDPTDFDKIIPSSELGEWNGKFWTDKNQVSKLQVCTGTIHYCRPHDGRILVDGGHNPPIPVFFVPQKYSISVSQSKKKKRVEFYIGFNPRHFAEAYEVTILRKYPCPNPACKTPTEISALGRDSEKCTTLCNRCETPVKVIH